MKEDEDYNEWLRSVKETLKEGGYSAVKREDLQWLIDTVDIHAVDIDRIKSDRIKEVYNIE